MLIHIVKYLRTGGARKVNTSQQQPSPKRGKERCVEGILAQARECQKRAGEFRSSGQRQLADQQLQRAIAQFSEAIRIDPTHSNAYVLRARAFEESGDDEKAEVDLEKAQQINTGDA